MTDEIFHGVPESIAAALQKRGFEQLTPVQLAVIQAVQATEPGQTVRDLRIASQTGSGKTVALGIALGRHFIEKSGGERATEALLIVPTRELVNQVRDELRWLYAGIPGVRVEGVMGGASYMSERSALSRKPSIVIATPGRLLDHIRSGVMACDRVAHVVLDEADRMLDMGFREELEAILDALPKERSSHMLSATFPRSVLRLADRFQSNPLNLQGTRAEDAHPDITHVAHLVRPRESYLALVNLLLLSRGSRSLLFVQRRVDAADIAERLVADGFSAQPLSGDLPQAQRTRALNAFRNGSVEIIVATDVAARGIDVPDIETVIHLDTPFDAETYVHRSGRTGRAGRQGRSLMLIPTSQERRMRRLISILGIEVDWQPAPGPSQVRKAARKQLRRELWERIDSTDGRTEQQLEYAAGLLAEREPAAVVAALLDMASSGLPCEPKNLSPAVASEKERFEKYQQDFVTFSLSWGRSKGASPKAILSQVCRRGGVSGQVVGAIRIESDHSTFQIASRAAQAFQAKTRKPDSRDPGVVIQRLNGVAPQRSPRPERGSRPERAKRPYPAKAHAKKDRLARPPRAEAARKRKPTGEVAST
ncbi:MAG: DEAD/DEAH box helicase [bacterium]|nr:DEAD/DEAH box helicase [bacterium]